MSIQSHNLTHCDYTDCERNSSSFTMTTCEFCNGDYCAIHYGPVDLAVSHIGGGFSVWACDSCLAKVDSEATETVVRSQLSAP